MGVCTHTHIYIYSLKFAGTRLLKKYENITNYISHIQVIFNLTEKMTSISDDA